MAVQKFTPTPTEVDLEATAELPGMDFAAVINYAASSTDAASSVDLASTTDIHAAPAVPSGVAELAISLREAEVRLARKMERVAGLEGELTTALRAAAELRVQLDHDSTQAAPRENALREAELQLGRNVERIAALEGELATAQHAAAELRTQLDKEIVQSARRETALRESELKLGARVERVTSLEGEVSKTQQASVELRAQLDNAVAESARREIALHDAKLELGRNLERVAALEAELSKAQHASSELRSQLDKQIVEGARRETTMREGELQLARNMERIARLDGDLASSQRATTDLRAKLEQDNAQAARRETELRNQVEAANQQLAGLRQEMAVRDAIQQRQAGDLVEVRRSNERLLESLQTWQGFRGVADAQLAEHDLLLVQANAEHAAQVAAVETRNSELQLELGSARIAAEHRVMALEASLRAAERAHGEDEQALKTLQQQNQELQLKLDQASTRTSRLEQDLHVAEEHIHRLEGESHSNAALLGSLQQNIERLARDDTGSRPALRVVSTEPAQRVLVREVDGAETVYPLGKRTTIGRTPDNDIQVDTSFISRHHAVMLSNPDQCLIEDLNSTNGVQVNGKLINRQALHDGDTVTIGKTEFRYLLRA